MFRFFGICLLGLLLTTMSAVAQNVRITPDTFSFEFSINGKPIVIGRNQDTGNLIDENFARTSRPCPPFCIHAMSAAPDVVTIGELELIGFLRTTVKNGKGLLIDTRVPLMHEVGTIPGAVNVPFSTLDPANPFRDGILKALGGRKAGDGWDYSGAMELALFCNGPWCDQSPRAIRNLRAAGYPAEKLRYYRGGMQVWSLLGLSVKQP